MQDPAHDRAQVLAAEAANLLRSGQRERALELYRSAAGCESEALERIPKDKSRSWVILAVSVAALWYKAAAFDRAEQIICAFLGSGEMPDWAVLELRELLESVWDDRVIAEAGFRYSGEEIQIALRGGLIGSGTAPFDTALHYMGGFTSLLYRVSEWEIRAPFRTRGLPKQEVQDAVQARATQPAIGSYRFAIKLAEPAQQRLFVEGDELHVRKVAEDVINIVRSASSEDASALVRTVPDERYRTAMMKLVRNVLPTTGLREIEISRGSKDKVTLFPSARSNITRHLRDLTPKNANARQMTTRGILRGLHLDKRWLEITAPNGQPRKLRTKPDELDDVLGPMVNRKVRARAEISPRGGLPTLIDIELEDER